MYSYKIQKKNNRNKNVPVGFEREPSHSPGALGPLPLFPGLVYIVIHAWKHFPIPRPIKNQIENP